VGAIYISVSSTSPATLFSGTSWSSFAAGRCLVGLDTGDGSFNQVEETGGAKTHTLSINEIPPHSHWYERSNYPNRNTGYPGNDRVGVNQDYTGSAGGGGAHNNLQPYIVVYMWKRTA
jgi:microcystin-dependent protein